MNYAVYKKSILWKFASKIKRRLDSTISSKLLDVKSMHECFNGVKKIPFYIKPELVETPEALEMRFLPQSKHLNKGKYTSPEIYSAVLKGTSYCSGDNTIVTEKNMIIRECSNQRFFPNLYNWRKHYFIKKKRIKGYATAYRSASIGTYNGFYHIIIDNIPRLYILGSDPELKENRGIKLLIPKNINHVEKFYLEKFLPANVKIKYVNIGHLYSIEKYVYTSFMNPIFSAYLPRKYLKYFLFKTLPNRPSTKNKKIYISRSKAARRRVINEHEVMGLLRQYGFEKYCLEDMPLQDQIDLFHDANFVVGPHGAGFVNLIFSDSIKVIEMFGIPYVKPNYYLLSKARGHEYLPLCFNEKFIGDDFYVDIERLHDKLKKLSLKKSGI